MAKAKAKAKKVSGVPKLGTEFSTTGNEPAEELFPQATVYELTVTFTRGLLGTVPYDKDVYAKFVASKAPEGTDTSDELSTVPALTPAEVQDNVESRGWTGFHTIKEEGKPGQYVLYDYAFKGFCKEVCGSLRNVPLSESKDLQAYKKRIDKLLHISPRQIVLHPPEGQEMFLKHVKTDEGLKQVAGLEVLERPLRAQTPQGERVTLVRSDMTPEGTWCKFRLAVLGAITHDQIVEWFKYGVLGGMGQWRSGGYGTFSVKARVVHEGEGQPEEAADDDTAAE